MKLIDLTLEHFNFYCPVTGQQICSEFDFNPSKATAFVYLNEIGDLVNSTPKIDKIVADLDPENYLCADELMHELGNTLDESNLVCFNLSVHEVGCCGPRSSVVRIGIDMSYNPGN